MGYIVVTDNRVSQMVEQKSNKVLNISRGVKFVVDLNMNVTDEKLWMPHTPSNKHERTAAQ